MARAIHVASDDSGVVAITGPGGLLGFSATAAAAADFVLRDGDDSTGAPLAFGALAAAGSLTSMVPGVEFRTGVFVDRSTAVELVLYVEE